MFGAVGNSPLVPAQAGSQGCSCGPDSTHITLDALGPDFRRDERSMWLALSVSPRGRGNPPPPVLRTDRGNSPPNSCLPMRNTGRWIADVVSETEGDGEVWLIVVSTPSWFDGRTLCVLLTMRAIGLRCCAACCSLRVSVFIRGRAASSSGVCQSRLRRSGLIWNVETTFCTSIANARSTASIQRSRGDGVTSPVCACLCRVMGAIIRPLGARSDLEGAVLRSLALEL